MKATYRDGAGFGDAGCGHWRPNLSIRRKLMRWETPQAVDLRFGMEITMYIANR
jgi:coenzyme PQQ precursor peptide PqqA